MLRSAGSDLVRTHGRHRLGTPGLVHCVSYPEVEQAMAERRRGWWTALREPARHSWAGLRRRAGLAPQALSPAA